MGKGDAMVEVREISRRFDCVLAVERVSMQIRRGDFLTILGPGGCGKTTLLRMIAGFPDPSERHVLIDGQPMNDMPAHRRSIGMVFQRLALFPHMTAAEHVAYPLRMRGFHRSVITPDLAAVSVVHIGVALVIVWAIDRLVGLEIFLKSR